MPFLECFFPVLLPQLKRSRPSNVGRRHILCFSGPFEAFFLFHIRKKWGIIVQTFWGHPVEHFETPCICKDRSYIFMIWLSIDRKIWFHVSYHKKCFLWRMGVNCVYSFTVFYHWYNSTWKLHVLNLIYHWLGFLFFKLGGWLFLSFPYVFSEKK